MGCDFFFKLTGPDQWGKAIKASGGEVTGQHPTIFVVGQRQRDPAPATGNIAAEQGPVILEKRLEEEFRGLIKEHVLPVGGRAPADFAGLEGQEHPLPATGKFVDLRECGHQMFAQVDVIGWKKIEGLQQGEEERALPQEANKLKVVTGRFGQQFAPRPFANFSPPIKVLRGQQMIGAGGNVGKGTGRREILPQLVTEFLKAGSFFP